MKTTNIKIMAAALAATITISSHAMAGTATQTPARRMPSSDYVKTIKVGRKGAISVVYELRPTSGHSTSIASRMRSPRKLVAIGNGYEYVEI
jgi:hypothetical protein